MFVDTQALSCGQRFGARLIELGGTPPVLRPYGGRRRLPLVAAAFEALLLGLAISILAGAAAGTVIIPGIGTIFGGLVGVFVGIAPTVVGTLAVVVLVSVKHRPLRDPAALHRDLWLVFLCLEVALTAVGVALAIKVAAEEEGDILFIAWWYIGPLIVDVPLVGWLLQRAASRLTATYARGYGWAPPSQGRRPTGPVMWSRPRG